MMNSGKPTCPNHGCPLDGLPFPMPSKGSGICPVSGATFEFEVSVEEDVMAKDANGNLSKKRGWKVEGND